MPPMNRPLSDIVAQIRKRQIQGIPTLPAMIAVLKDHREWDDLVDYLEKTDHSKWQAK